MLGPLQLVLILVIIVVIFGAGKIPNLMGDLGKGIKNFRKNVKDEGSDAKNIEDKNQEK
ncbi:MAG: sec-independent protein translocase protein TatA [Lentimonas sp.]|jgi:sec-independent protein translocase protein TatA